MFISIVLWVMSGQVSSQVSMDIVLPMLDFLSLFYGTCFSTYNVLVFCGGIMITIFSPEL